MASYVDHARLKLLDGALDALLETLQPTQEADESRRVVVAEMQQLVKQALPAEFHCSLETFGSYRAGLHLPGSDLDFALSGWVSGPDERPIELYEWNNLEQQYLLSDLADALEQAQLVRGQVERVLHARVPVIKFTHKESGLACDFSINRPECTFKADMQKLLGSLDRRYSMLYRLVKAWAAAHGLNDAAANTLNSWSLGLLVAFYLQCGTSPSVLPPIWQLLENEAPDVRQPRVLQLPNVNLAMLKRVFNQAAIGAGAFLGRRQRAGADAVNACSTAELLAGFFEFYTPVLTDWSQGRNSSWRASTWWGDWKDAAWYPAKQYIFSIEDPFNAGDNTARAVGTHNHLSSSKTACYIAATVAASHQQLQRALSSDSSSSGSSSGSSSSSDCGPLEREVLTTYAWLFGPHSVVQLRGVPNPLRPQLQQEVAAALCDQLQQQLDQLGDCMDLLSCSSGLVNRDNSSVTKDPARVALITKALKLYRQLLKGLGCSGCHVCLGDYLQHRREIEAREAKDREQQRQQEERRRELLAQRGAENPDDNWQQQQMPDEVLAAMQGLRVGSSNSDGNSHQQQRQPRSRRWKSAQHIVQSTIEGDQQQQYDTSMGDGLLASSSGGSSSGRGRDRRQASAPPDIPTLVQHPSRRQQQQQGSGVHRDDLGHQLGVAQQRVKVAVVASRAQSDGSSFQEGPVGSRLAASALAGVVGSKGSSRQVNGCASSSSQQRQAYAEQH